MEQVLSGEEKRVCVTGDSGYVASWIVKLLLQRGYIVNATVRSLNDPTKTEHLLAMDGAQKRLHLFEANLLEEGSFYSAIYGCHAVFHTANDPTKTEHLLALDGAQKRLHLFEANLLEEGSFDSAIYGCLAVFHTASPVILFSTNPQVELIDPAVKGTLNVLGSCAKSPSLKRVVLTSSVAAVAHTGTPLVDDTIIDETWLSSPEICMRQIGPIGAGYLVSINPAITIGPLLQPTINMSVLHFVYNLFNVSETYPSGRFGWVHVKDTAEAHIRALEIPYAKGRYILSETTAHVSEIVETLRELYPSLKLPHKCEKDEALVPKFRFSKEKAETLGSNMFP